MKLAMSNSVRVNAWMGIVLCAFFLVCTGEASARIWYVGGSGADFSEIQPAIDAATAGDVILVRTGTYQPFSLSKGLVISASDAPFIVTGIVRVMDIPAGEHGAISGMTTSKVLVVRACSGEVNLEHLDIGVDAGACLHVADCAHVSVTSMHARVTMPNSRYATQAVRLESSSVRMTEVTIEAGRGEDGFFDFESGTRGQFAVGVIESLAVIADANVSGGRGGTGATWFGDGGAGGIAFDVLDSDLHLHGLTENLVRGGDGGSAGAFGNFGGNGADGVLNRGSSIVVSRMTVEGGRGGGGVFQGNDGSPGVFDRDDRYPLLKVNDFGSMNPGSSVNLLLDAVRPGRVFMMLSGSGGFIPTPHWIGPPLSVDRSSWYFLLGLGATNNVGDYDKTFQLPANDALRGMVLNMQTILLSYHGPVYVSNSVCRVIGE